MKKHFFIGLAAIALMTGCSSDETLEVAKGNAIRFDTFVNASTKANDITNENIDQFKIFGFAGTEQVFNGGTVSKTGDVWTYDNIVFWQPNKTYHFHAIAPISETFTADASDKAKGTITFDNTGDKDLIYAHATKTTQTTITSDPGDVQLEFKHLLSRVRFQFTNSMGNEHIGIAVKDVKITNSLKNGSCSVGNASDSNNANTTWTVSGAETATLNFQQANQPTDGTAEENHIIKKGQSASTDHLYLLPESSKAYTAEFTVEVYVDDKKVDNKTKTFKATLPAISTESQNSYQFSATIDHNVFDLYPIVFTVTVDDWSTTWTSGGNVTITDPSSSSEEE